MFNLLIDTCVWFDLVKDRHQEPLLSVLEQMVDSKSVSLIVPKVLLDEFLSNRARIAGESAKSVAAPFQLVKQVVKKSTLTTKKKSALVDLLEDVKHRAPLLDGNAEGLLNRIDRLLRSAPIIETSPALLAKAADRALKLRAPCHHKNKNSIADAILFDTFVEVTTTPALKGQRFAFVTHNKSDFSAQAENQKLPHPDLAPAFSKIRNLYFISLVECLRRVDPSLVSQTMYEASWSDEPRGLTELLRAEDLLFHQVWYNRHWNTRSRVETGKIKIVQREKVPHEGGVRNTIQADVWAGALKAAKRVEKKYGISNLGPWTDFEWGMVNGKLSAIRWMLGDEWDMLDT